jgi:hypothetical protein
VIHISRTKKKQYIVAVVSDKNGKVISCSEPLKRWSNAKKNIVALLNATDSRKTAFQDNTKRVPVVGIINNDGVYSFFLGEKTHKPYQPK